MNFFLAFPRADMSENPCARKSVSVLPVLKTVITVSSLYVQPGRMMVHGMISCGDEVGAECLAVLNFHEFPFEPASGGGDEAFTARSDRFERTRLAVQLKLLRVVGELVTVEIHFFDEVGLGDGLSVPGGAGAEVEDGFRSVGEFRGGSFGDHRSGLAEKGETLRFARIIFLFVFARIRSFCSTNWKKRTAKS